MLYDNAQLARVYIHAWAVTGDARYRDVATGTLDYLLRELTTDDGAFAASQDADTDGVEGATFTWRSDEIRSVLGDDAALFSTAYGVTEGGNWEGVTVLSRVRPTAELATLYGVPAGEVDARLAQARTKLLAARDRRPQPARDDKALAAWNGLAIGALADAARLLAFAVDDAAGAQAARYRAAAERAAETILGGLLDGDGRLGRSWKDGRATGQGVLEDYADLADGLLALYGATFDERWFVAARRLADQIVAHFADPAGGFFDTADDHERLVTRPRDPQDNATPSGGAMATRRPAAAGRVHRRRAIPGCRGSRDRHDHAVCSPLPVRVRDVAPGDRPRARARGRGRDRGRARRSGDASPARSRERRLRPDPGGRAVDRWGGSGPDGDAAASAIPLLHDRARVGGRPTAYVCRGFACRLPVTDPDALREQLAEVAATV